VDFAIGDEGKAPSEVEAELANLEHRFDGVRGTSSPVSKPHSNASEEVVTDPAALGALEPLWRRLGPILN
jgi:hypothetical protein